jgi:serine/threonine protein kinase
MSDRCPRCSAELAAGANYCARCGALLSAPPAASDALIGSVVLGRYRVVRLLGEGGMGKVYLAEQAMGQATRPVALKTLRKELSGDPKVSGRFLRESEIVIRLAHPNTIQFYDFGQLDDGSMVIVMEYIEGRTLAEELRSGPLPLARIDALMSQICGSLAEAHAHGIVHRDLKPQNVLLTTRAGRDDFVKLVDFGIAMRRGHDGDDPTRLTTHGSLVGTPPYMSPEQFQDRDVDARSDVYALGVMLYQLLTGELPFSAKTPWQWAAAHIDTPPKPLDEHPSARDLPRTRIDAVMRALAKDPAERPSDASELLREFAGVAAGAQSPPRLVATARATDEPEPSPTTRAGTTELPNSSWVLWLPVALIVAAGGVIAWRNTHTVDDSIASAARSAPASDSTQPKRPPSRQQRAGVTDNTESQRRTPRRAASDPKPDAKLERAAPTANERGSEDQSTNDERNLPGAPAEPTLVAQPGKAVASNDSAATNAVRNALNRGELAAALDAFESAQAQLSPDHSELPELRAQLSTLAGSSAQSLAERGECDPLRALARRLARVQADDSPALQGALEGCRTAANSSTDAAPNSAPAE